MSKFLPIGTKGELLNSDMIARIIPKEDGGCIILTKDGQHFHSEIDLHDEVNDYNSIRSIIPCQGVSAVYLDDDGDSEICPGSGLLFQNKWRNIKHGQIYQPRYRDCQHQLHYPCGDGIRWQSGNLYVRWYDVSLRSLRCLPTIWHK